MKKIIAIGGGEIGRPGKEIETRAIDEETIRLTGKAHPKVLFLPTASGDSEGYIETVKHYFGGILGCEVDSLKLHGVPEPKEDREKKILSSDIVYVGGGNTLTMMKLWRKYQIDVLLRQAWENGVVMTGLSAGSICWFDKGQSDSQKKGDSDEDFGFIKVTGLGFMPVLHCPHYDIETRRRPALLKMMEKSGDIAIALDNCAAIEVIDDMYRIIASKPGVKAYKVYRKDGQVIEEIIEQVSEFRDIKELFKK